MANRDLACLTAAALGSRRKIERAEGQADSNVALQCLVCLLLETEPLTF